ncbi:MAG: NACHT domain-containing protein [Cyanobacteria bacterium P01_E01_bin.42]
MISEDIFYQEYYRQYWKDFSKQKASDLSLMHPFNLDAIFVAPLLIPFRSLSLLTLHSKLKKARNKKLKDSYFERKRDERFKAKKGFDVIKNYEKIIDARNGELSGLAILGEPGMGKSTFLQRIGLEYLEGLEVQKTQFGDVKVPVFIELKTYNAKENLQNYDPKQENSINCIERTIQERIEKCNISPAEQVSNHYLNKGNFLILLDGLDEVSSGKRENLISHINGFIEQYPSNKFILSCRTEAYDRNLNFKAFKILGLGKKNIEELIYKWFENWSNLTENKAKLVNATKLIEKLRDDEYISCKDLAQTPLLLTLICAAYDKTLDLHKQKSQIYKKALEFLLYEWSSIKGINQTKKLIINYELQEKVLSEIAFHGFKDDRICFSDFHLVSKIKVLLEKSISRTSLSDDSFGKKSEIILNQMIVDQGIFRKESEGFYYFSHLTMQEYLAALYIDRQAKDNEIEKLIEDRISDRAWREVFLIASGVAHNETKANQFLMMLERKTLSLVEKNSEIVLLLQWTESIISQEKPDYFSPLQKRVIILLVFSILTGIPRVQESVEQDKTSEKSPCDKSVLTASNAISAIEKLFEDLKIDLDMRAIYEFGEAMDVANRIKNYIHDRQAHIKDEKSYKKKNLEPIKEIDQQELRVKEIIIDLKRFWETLRERKVLRSRNTDKIIQILDEIVQKLRSPENDKRINGYFEVRNRIYGEIHKALDPDNAIGKISKGIDRNFTIITRYIDATRLLLNCKDNTVHATKDVWEGIYQRMLNHNFIGLDYEKVWSYTERAANKLTPQPDIHLRHHIAQHPPSEINTSSEVKDIEKQAQIKVLNSSESISESIAKLDRLIGDRLSIFPQMNSIKQLEMAINILKEIEEYDFLKRDLLQAKKEGRLDDLKDRTKLGELVISNLE